MRAAGGRRRPLFRFFRASPKGEEESRVFATELLLIRLFASMAALTPMNSCSLATGPLAAAGGTPVAETPIVDSIPAPGEPSSWIHIRPGTPGSGDGSSWGAALPSLPARLERGKTYWIAAGSYATPDFASIADGDEWVQLRRATVSAHGSSGGWQDSFADGAVVLPPMAIAAPRIYLDGGTDTGMKCLGTYQSTVVEVKSDNVILRRIDIDGNFQMNQSGYHTGGAGTGLAIEGDDVSILGCAIHGVADDAVVVSRSSRLTFKNNKIYGMFGRGTGNGTGPCENGHSDGLELSNVSDSIFDGNLVLAPSEGMTTAALYLAEWGLNRNLLFCNNVFYRETSFAVYFFLAENIRFYNNTVWGTMEGGPWGGGAMIGGGVSGLDLSNNILLFARFADGVTWNSSLYVGSHNLFGKDLSAWPLQAGDKVAADPGFAGIPDADSTNFVSNAALGDFMPKAGSAALDSGAAIATVDHDAEGSPRPSGSACDIGALER